MWPEKAVDKRCHHSTVAPDIYEFTSSCSIYIQPVEVPKDPQLQALWRERERERERLCTRRQCSVDVYQASVNSKVHTQTQIRIRNIYLLRVCRHTKNLTWRLVCTLDR